MPRLSAKKRNQLRVNAGRSFVLQWIDAHREEYNGEDPSVPIVDLVANILHYSIASVYDPGAIAQRALEHVKAEVAEEAAEKER